MANKKFSQFVVGGRVVATDIVVGLRDGENTQFDGPVSVVISWDGSTDQVDVTAGTGISIAGGVIDAIVNTWNGTTTAVDVLGGTGITLADGTINAVVNTWNGTTTAVDVLGGTGITLSGGTINAVVKSWDGSITAVDVTRGTGISIADGVINAVVNTWNGTTTAVDVLGGTGITLVDGTINAVVNTWNGTTTAVDVLGGTGITLVGGTINGIVTSWNGSTTAVDIVGGTGITLVGGAINAVIKSWDGSTTPVDVTAGTNMDITDGVISTSAEANVVTSWDGSTDPVDVTAGRNMTITGGVIATSADVNVVTAWNGSTTPVAVTAGRNMTLTSGVVATSADVNVVTSWGGLTIPTDVTAGRNIILLFGEILTVADVNVVTSWNGSTSGVSVSAGRNIGIGGGTISTNADPNVVVFWDFSTTPINVRAGSGIDISGGVIQLTGASLASWDGSTSAVTVTAGEDIDITGGTISCVFNYSDQLIYVSGNGDDTTGDGTIKNPYQTINHALSTISLNSPTFPITIVLDGIYNESSVVSLLPNVNIIGMCGGCYINNDLSLDASWGSAAAGSVSYLQNISVNNINFDFSISSPTNPPTLFLTSVNVLSVCDINGYSNNTTVTSLNCTFNSIILNNITFFSSLNTFSGAVAPSVQYGLSNNLNDLIVTSISDTYNGAVELSSGSFFSSFIFSSCFINDTVTGTGSVTDIKFDAVSYVQAALSGGATASLLTTSNAIDAHYSPLNYTATDGSVFGNLQGIDNELGILAVGTTPVGPAGGDLAGTYPNPIIATNAVTFSKFQQMIADTLLGNPTGSTANTQAITLGSALVFSGTSLQVANLGITNAMIANTTIDLTTKVTGILPATNGGTGVNNGSNTITLGGSLTTQGTITVLSGSNTGDQTITLTGDVTGSGTGSFATTIANTVVTASSYGDGTHVASFTVNSQGRLTAASNVLITGAPPIGSAGGDLSSTYPNPTVSKINGVTLGSTTATAGNLLVASAGNQWVSVASSGNVTVSSTGVFTIGALQVTNSMIANTTIDLTTKVTGILPAANGGTGVNNSFTITLGGNISTAGSFTTSGANPLTLTTTGSTNVTLPTSGTLATTSQIVQWTSVSGTTQAMAVNSGYIAANASTVVFTLPATAVFGSVIRIAGLGSGGTGGWQIAQNAGQLIHIGTQVTTTGTGGSLSSTNTYDSISLLCVVANTTFVVLDGPMGNITYV